MNPLSKIRSASAASVSKIRGGAASAGSKVRGGAAKGWGKTTGGVKGAVRGARDRAGSLSGGARDNVAELWDRSGGGRLAAEARSKPRVAIAWAVLGILVLAWIAWTVYVWSENGSTAGLGVLISWPAAIAALTLVAAPFVGAILLVRRLRPGDSPPPMAGGADSGDHPETTTGGTYPG